MTLTAAQVRRACAFLNWKSATLSRRAGVGYTVAMHVRTEAGIAALPWADVWAVRMAMERAGVRFTAEGAALRVKAS